MDTNKLNQMIRIAKMHYEMNYTQLEIASREGISKATVSRILKAAMDMGIIEVRIKDSILNDTSLEKELISAYPIKRAVIVPDLVGNPQMSVPHSLKIFRVILKMTVFSAYFTGIR